MRLYFGPCLTIAINFIWTNLDTHVCLEHHDGRESSDFGSNHRPGTLSDSLGSAAGSLRVCGPRATTRTPVRVNLKLESRSRRLWAATRPGHKIARY